MISYPMAHVGIRIYIGPRNGSGGLRRCGTELADDKYGDKSDLDNLDFSAIKDSLAVARDFAVGWRGKKF